MNTLLTVIGFGTCLAIIGLMGRTVVEAFMVIKYGLVDDDIYNEDED
nr:MAG TPA: hypothetical protein [Caudoviricetes sp.]